MARLRSNNVFGTVDNNPLAAGGTSLSADELANLVAVTGTDRAVITLDPNRVNGAPEIVYVTAHTASATTATILRGQEGTVARQHPAGTFWVHAPTALDIELPNEPAACRVYHNVAQSLADTTETTVVFNSERYDTDSMHSTVSLTSRITFNTAGLYLVGFHGVLPGGADYSNAYCTLRLNGSTVLAYGTGVVASGSPLLQVHTAYTFAAADYVEVRCYQDNTANTARNLESIANGSPEFSATRLGSGD